MWRVIGATPLYRSSIASLFLAGIAVSSASPQIGLYFVDELHTSVALAGLYYLTNLASPIAGFYVGRFSDRYSDRLRIVRAGACVGAAGWVCMAAAAQPWMPFAISVVALSVSAAASSQIYAAARDQLSRDPTGADIRVMATIRMAFTGGWIIGPVAGSVIGGAFGQRVLFLVTALFTLAQLLPLARLAGPRHSSAPQPLAPSGGDAKRRTAPLAPLLVFSGLCALSLCGDTMKFAFLPLYMQHGLGAPPVVRGVVIATQPVFELLLIPVASWFAERFGSLRVLGVGAAFGVGAHFCYAFSTSVGQLFLGQFLMAVLWAAVAGLGVNTAQRLYPAGVGLASSVFLSSLTFSTAIGGLVGSVGSGVLGLPRVFIIPGLLCFVALLGLVGLGLHNARQRHAS